jgi:hypothetical protein
MWQPHLSVLVKVKAPTVTERWGFPCALPAEILPEITLDPLEQFAFNGTGEKAVKLHYSWTWYRITGWKPSSLRAGAYATKMLHVVGVGPRPLQGRHYSALETVKLAIDRFKG